MCCKLVHAMEELSMVAVLGSAQAGAVNSCAFHTPDQPAWLSWSAAPSGMRAFLRCARLCRHVADASPHMNRVQTHPLICGAARVRSAASSPHRGVGLRDDGRAAQREHRADVAERLSHQRAGVAVCGGRARGQPGRRGRDAVADAAQHGRERQEHQRERPALGECCARTVAVNQRGLRLEQR